LANEIFQEKTGYQAYSIAEGLKKIDTPQWQREKLAIMKEILIAKYQTCPEYRKAIAESDDRELVEDTTNTFWARGTPKPLGKNMLGVLHMEIRAANKPPAGEQRNNQHANLSANTTTAWSNVAKSPPIMQSPPPSSLKATNPSTPTVPARKPTPPTTPAKATPEKQIAIIGNSITASIDFSDIKLSKTSLQHIRKPTLQESKKYIDAMEHKIDTIIIHQITNDIGPSPTEAETCAQQVVKLAEEATNKADKVVISLGIPRSDNFRKHEATKLANILIKSQTRGNGKIQTVSNDHLLFHGKANHNYMAADGYHLNPLGKKILKRNILKAIGYEDNTQQHQNNSPRKSEGKGYNNYYNDYHDQQGYYYYGRQGYY
jgi:hypothetical protein